MVPRRRPEAKAFAAVLERVQPGEHVRFYETRSSVTTGMKDAGVDHTVRMYVTGHSLERQILAHYEHQDIHRHMARYFAFIEPLLSAIAQRAGQLGIND